MTADITVEIIERPSTRLGTIRRVGPYGPEIGQAFEKLSSIAGPAGLFGPGMEMLALYHDNPEQTPADQLRSDASISVPEGRSMPEGLGEYTLAGGRYAKYVHLGSYSGIPDAWHRFLADWLPKSGHNYRHDGPVAENYVNNPMQVPENELITELLIPIE